MRGLISPISSRNSVPPEASSNLPVVLGDGAGEGAALVAEELGFDQVVGDGGAVDRDEGLGGALAAQVDGLGDQLLARAAFARDQHSRIGRATFSIRRKICLIAGDVPIIW